MAKKASETVSGFKLMNVVALIVVIGIFGFGGHFIGKQNANNSKSVEEQVEATQVIAYEGVDGKTALDLLKERAEIQSQESSLGVFVTSINGTSNSDTQFWLFYVNGEMAPFASDQYQTKNGDKIEWRYEKLE